ncbi:unnamed protein product [Ectocarpus sp. 13 AM-2016]
MVTGADVDDMRQHFSPDLFSPLDIVHDRRLCRNLLQNCKARYIREVETQKTNKRHGRGPALFGDSTSSTPDVEVVEAPPTMTSDVSTAGIRNRSAKATQRAQ